MRQVYTVPRWDALVVAPIQQSPYPVVGGVAALLYASFALMVGLHTLAFWKLSACSWIAPSPDALLPACGHSRLERPSHQSPLDASRLCAVGSIGTVPAAISKGAQQGGTFLLAHVLFCHIDETECMSDSREGASAWSRVQKPLSFAICALGCLVYAIVRKRNVDKPTGLGLGGAATSPGGSPSPPSIPNEAGIR